MGSGDVHPFLRDHGFYGQLASAASPAELKRYYIQAKREKHPAILEAEGDWGRSDGRRAEVRRCFWAWYDEQEDKLTEQNGSYTDFS